MSVIRGAHLVIAWLFVAGVVFQVFLAGLGVFDSAAMFATHATWGYTLELLPIVMFALALAGRLGRRQVAFAVGLFAMFMLQSIFIAVRVDMPAVAALHPVNGFGILLVGVVAAREAWLERRSGTVRKTAPTTSSAQGIVGR